MSLLAHYKLNGDATDASGNGHDGTPTDVSWVAGKIGQAGDFDGDASKADCGNALSITGLGGYSMSAWIYVDTWESQRGIFSNNPAWSGADGVRLAFTLNLYSDNRSLALEVGDGTDYTRTNSSYNDADEGAWHHVAFVRDAATGYVTFYVDGEASGGGANDRVLAASENTWEIGRNNKSNTYCLDGKIDDLRVYDEELTAGQIQRIYHEGHGTENTLAELYAENDGPLRPVLRGS